MPKRGEIWRVQMPVRGGHAQSGVRPALIVQADVFNTQLPTTIIIPFDEQSAGANLCRLDSGRSRSAKRLDPTIGRDGFSIVTVDQRDCLALLGQLDPATFDLILDNLDRLTGR